MRLSFIWEPRGCRRTDGKLCHLNEDATEQKKSRGTACHAGSCTSALALTWLRRSIPFSPNASKTTTTFPKNTTPAAPRGADSAVNVCVGYKPRSKRALLWCWCRYQTTRVFTQLLLSRLLRSNEELACCEQIADFSCYTR